MILQKVDPAQAPLSAYASVLGINVLTAYLAFTDLGQPKSGDAVVVTTAAGSVGSIVGQIARELGCRVIGLTGSDTKSPHAPSVSAMTRHSIIEPPT